MTEKPEKTEKTEKTAKPAKKRVSARQSKAKRRRPDSEIAERAYFSHIDEGRCDKLVARGA